MSVLAGRLLGSRTRRRAEAAAVAESLDDPAFAPDGLRRFVANALTHLTGGSGTWRIEAIGRLLGGDAVAGAIDLVDEQGIDLEREQVAIEVSEQVRVDVVGVRLGDDRHEQQATLRIEADVRAWRSGSSYRRVRLTDLLRGSDDRFELAGLREPRLARRTRIVVIWVLRRPATDQGWQIAWISADALRPGVVGAHDTRERRLEGRAVLGLADEGFALLTLPEEISRALPADPAAALLELGLLDGAYDDRVIAAAAGEIVDAWQRASEGERAALEAAAEPSAARALLGSRGELLRGAGVEAARVHRLLVGRNPVEVVVELEVRGWLGPRDDGVDWASDARFQLRRHRWALRRSPDPRHPWRLARVLEDGDDGH